jgi:hypothetical protein
MIVNEGTLANNAQLRLGTYSKMSGGQITINTPMIGHVSKDMVFIVEWTHSFGPDKLELRVSESDIIRHKFL